MVARTSFSVALGSVLFSLHGVSKRYGESWALRETTLSFEPGLSHALIGPSGCGKSTLLRLLNGLIEPSSGEVRFGGEPATPKTQRAIRLRTGYVIQHGGLFPHMTARQNVTLMARRLGWDADRIAERVSELCGVAQLEEAFLDRVPGRLSGGQRQRVGIIRSLMLDPDVLLMDEPMGALDPLVRAQLQDELVALFRRLKKTVIVVTHDMFEAKHLGDTITLMRAGAIAQRGPYEALRDEPADEFVAEFMKAQRALGAG